MAISKRNSHKNHGSSKFLGKEMNLRNGSRFMRPDTTLHEYSPKVNPAIDLKLTPIEELDLMISQGYGNVPQNQLPIDWRTRRRGSK